MRNLAENLAHEVDMMLGHLFAPAPRTQEEVLRQLGMRLAEIARSHMED